MEQSTNTLPTINKKIPSKSTLMYPEIYISGDYIVTKNKETQNETKIARKMTISKILRNIDTNEISMELQFNYKNQENTINISREYFTKRKIIDLQKFGIDVLDNTATQIIKHLHNQEQISPEMNVHNKLGWDIYQDNLVFKHYNGIGVNSQYNGNFNIKPNGTLEEWTQMVNRFVLGNTPLELAILFGLSSSLIGLIGQDIGADTLFVHIYGDSTHGKTTATRLAVSTFGYPHTDENGIMTTWLATNNAIVANLNGNNGLVVALDEVSMADLKDFSNLIYKFAGGKDKLRMNKDSSLKESGRWRTTIVSNGEFALSSKVNKNIGIRMRLLEFGNIMWTKDALHADSIKEIALKNYGHAGIKFSNYLRKIGKTKLISLWKSWVRKIVNSIENKTLFSERIASKLALIMLTCQVAKTALKIDFNEKEILSFLIENEKANEDKRDIGMDAYNYFLEKFNVHKKHFECPKVIHTSNGIKIESYEIWGTSKPLNNSNSIEVCIIPSIFEKWMKEGGFEDSKIILTKWREKKLIDCEKNRFTRKRKINSTVPILVYCIHIKDTYK